MLPGLEKGLARFRTQPREMPLVRRRLDGDATRKVPVYDTAAGQSTSAALIKREPLAAVPTIIGKPHTDRSHVCGCGVGARGCQTSALLPPMPS